MSDIVTINPKDKNIKPSKLQVASKYLIFDPAASNPALFLNNKKGLEQAKQFYAGLNMPSVPGLPGVKK